MKLLSCDVTSYNLLWRWILLQQKRQDRGGGWAHLKGADSMAVSELSLEGGKHLYHTRNITGRESNTSYVQSSMVRTQHVDKQHFIPRSPTCEQTNGKWGGGGREPIDKFLPYMYLLPLTFNT